MFNYFFLYALHNLYGLIENYSSIINKSLLFLCSFVKQQIPQFGIKKRLVACEDRYMNSLPMLSDMGYI